MALLRKQADLETSGFYIMEAPNTPAQKYVLGPLISGEEEESLISGQFKSYDLQNTQLLGASWFTLSFDDLETELKSLVSLSLRVPPMTLDQDDKDSYFKTFQCTKENMERSDLQKAVLYTKLESVWPGNSFITLSDFASLCLRGLKNRKSGYLYGFYNPCLQTACLGNSPEYIFNQTKKDTNSSSGSEKMISVVAVAGTRRSTSQSSGWSDKLIHEHQMVMDGMSESLKYTNIEWGPVHEYSYGDLVHLRSEGEVLPGEASGKTLGKNFCTNYDMDKKVENLSKLLHPTPAVGTLPQKYYNQINLGPEGRGFFGGYAEILSYEAMFSLVTIRCFEWSAEKVQVCIGGGVLAESLVEEEWAELEDKWTSFKALWEL